MVIITPKSQGWVIFLASPYPNVLWKGLSGDAKGVEERSRICCVVLVHTELRNEMKPTSQDRPHCGEGAGRPGPGEPRS